MLMQQYSRFHSTIGGMITWFATGSLLQDLMWCTCGGFDLVRCSVEPIGTFGYFPPVTAIKMGLDWQKMNKTRCLLWTFETEDEGAE